MPRETVFPLKPIVPLTDDEWGLISPILGRHLKKGGRPCIDARRSVEGMRWVASTHKPWVDLPAEYGNAPAVRRYYARIARSGIIEELLAAFPNSMAIDSAKNQARLRAGHKVECLRQLTERRPRGKAARAQKAA